MRWAIDRIETRETRDAATDQQPMASSYVVVLVVAVTSLAAGESSNAQLDLEPLRVQAAT